MKTPWVDPIGGKPSCPLCGGFGTPDDNEEIECPVCDGDGVAEAERAERWLAQERS